VELLARLDRKNDLRVLCGSGGRTCHGELASVAVTEVAVTMGGRRREPGERLLCMLAGWRELPTATDGKRHWTQSDHAARHAERTRKALRLRRPTTTSIEDFDVTNIYIDGRLIKDVILLDPEGILATCPRCGHENTLTVSELRVAPR
jgi:hypothetical protein